MDLQSYFKNKIELFKIPYICNDQDNIFYKFILYEKYSISPRDFLIKYKNFFWIYHNKY